MIDARGPSGAQRRPTFVDFQAGRRRLRPSVEECDLHSVLYSLKKSLENSTPALFSFCLVILQYCRVKDVETKEKSAKVLANERDVINRPGSKKISRRLGHFKYVGTR